MAITLAAAAPGRLVTLKYSGSPREFYVHSHGTDRTTLIQRYTEGSLKIGDPYPNGYIGSGVDSYLQGTYLSGFEPDVIAVLPTEIEYWYKEGYMTSEVLTARTTRSAYILTYNELKAGGCPIVGTNSDGQETDYHTGTVEKSSDWFFRVDSSGSLKTTAGSSNYPVRPVISLPNNTLVEDDGTLVVVSQDAANLLPCIKY